MRFFDADAVHAGLDYPALVAALAEHHRRDVDLVRSHVLEQPAPSPAPAPAVSGRSAPAEPEVAHFLTLPAWQRDRALGAKLVTVFPGNERAGQGLPSVQAVYVLFDGEDGRPLACIDGTALTLRKTAADSALGTRYLAREGARRMLMVGAGALAPHLVAAHRAVRPDIGDVAIWNRTPERAERLAATLAGQGVPARATRDLEGSAREADVISCATMATEPLVHGAWLKPGAHLDLVGSYLPEMRECDDEAMIRGEVFVDSPWSAMRDCGEIVGPMAAGLLVESDVRASLFELARGEHPGRQSEDAITVFENGGGGHLDLMVAQVLCRAD